MHLPASLDPPGQESAAAHLRAVILPGIEAADPALIARPQFVPVPPMTPPNASTIRPGRFHSC